MNWFKLLILFRKLPFEDLLSFPKDITNSTACRKWVLAVLDSFELLAELTNNELDDDAIETIEGLIRNDNAWSLIHGAFIKVMGGCDLAQLLDFPEFDDSERWIGSRVRGFNPMIIMVIIQAVVLVLKLFKSRMRLTK